VVAGGALLLSLVLGCAAAAAAVVAPRGGDAAVLFGCDVIGAVPALLLIVAAQGLFGRASLAGVIVLISIPRAADVARLVRAELRRALATPFAEAARAVGAGESRLIARHALPHALPQLAVSAAITVSTAVLAESALSFVGFGAPPPAASWGEMLRQAQQSGLAWWLTVPAGALIALAALAANTLADELTRRQTV
jgi:peptide/nickel transport system permease protein